MGIKAMAERKATKEWARREAKLVDETLSRLYFGQEEYGEDNAEDIDGLTEYRRLLVIAIRSGSLPPELRERPTAE